MLVLVLVIDVDVGMMWLQGRGVEDSEVVEDARRKDGRSWAMARMQGRSRSVESVRGGVSEFSD